MAMDPSMPFYVNDWLSSQKTACMTLEQQGAYVRLLCYCWASQSASIPDDDAVLAKLSGMNEGWFNGGSQMVRVCFVTHPHMPSFLTNEKLLDLWNERQEWREKSAAAGRKSGESRRKSRKSKDKQLANQPSTNLGTKHEPNTNSSSSLEEEGAREISWAASAEQGVDLCEPTAGDRLMFLTGPSARALDFIAAYPKKTKPAHAALAYEAAISQLVGLRGIADAQAHDWLIRRTREFAHSPAGQEPSGLKDFRPSAAEWLTSGGYDEPDSAWRFVAGDAPRSTQPPKPRVSAPDPSKVLQTRRTTENPPLTPARPHLNLGDQLLAQLSQDAPF